jgi:regulator of replication initiation timing
MGSEMKDGDVEELRKEVARLSVEVEMLKAKVRICLEITARLREELESLRRKAKRLGLKEYIKTLKAYDEVDAGEPESP